MRRAFTLLELMIVVAIMAAMTAVGLVSVRTGQGAARIRGATRDIVATIRHSRSKALVLMQPVVVTYATRRVDGEPCASVTADGAKLMETAPSGRVQTLSGYAAPETGANEGATAVESEGADASEGGETMSDILFQPISEQVVKGVCIKVAVGDEALEQDETAQRKASRVSVFSNVDYLLGRYRDSRKDASAEEKEDGGRSGGAASAASSDGDQAPVSVVWEANGRCDPHRVWVYLSGSRPEDGLCISVDRFGATKVLPGSGEEED